MQTASIRPDGSLVLGEEAQRAGYAPLSLVQIVVLSTGSLLVTPLDQTGFILETQDILKLPPKARRFRRALR